MPAPTLPLWPDPHRRSALAAPDPLAGFSLIQVAAALVVSLILGTVAVAAISEAREEADVAVMKRTIQQFVELEEQVRLERGEYVPLDTLQALKGWQLSPGVEVDAVRKQGQRLYLRVRHARTDARCSGDYSQAEDGATNRIECFRDGGEGSGGASALGVGFAVRSGSSGVSQSRFAVGEPVLFAPQLTDPTRAAGHHWEFDDGAAAESGDGAPRSLTRVFLTPGVYRVRLTVTDRGDDVAVSAYRDVVVEATGGVGPTAVLAFAPDGTEPGADVAFDARGSHHPQGASAIRTYAIEFGDGQPGVAADRALHRYGAAGVYTARLTVTDTAGRADTAFASVRVESSSFPLDFGIAPQPGTARQPVSFVADSTGAGGGARYFWVWGDGTPPGSGSAARHTFAAAGTYPVTLTVVRSDGRIASVARPAVVIAAPAADPVAGFVASSGACQTLTLDGTSSTDGGYPALQWSWDPGDFSGPKGGPNPSHTYSAGGTYPVRLTVTNGAGRTSSLSRNVTVRDCSVNLAPAGSLQLPAVVQPGQRFEGRIDGISDPNGDPVTVTWEWGDFTSGPNGPAVNHTYSADGSYTVTATLSDGRGGTTVLTGSVRANAQPTVSEVRVEGALSPGATVRLFTNAADADGRIASVHFSYRDVDRGGAWTYIGQGEGSSWTIPNLPGSYQIWAGVYDNDGGYGWTNPYKTVVNQPPIGNITYGPAAPSSGDALTFQANASDPDGTISGYWWNYLRPDGSEVHFSAATAPSQAFPTPGTYQVRVRVTDNHGAAVWLSPASVTVANRPPTGAVSGPAVVNPGLAFGVSATVTDPDGTVTGYWWSYVRPDGSEVHFSTAQAPTLSLASPGTYQVKVSVTDDHGASTWLPPISVRVNSPPLARFAALPAFTMVDEPVTLDLSPSADPDGDALSGQQLIWVDDSGNWSGYAVATSKAVSWTRAGTYGFHGFMYDAYGAISSPYATGSMRVYAFPQAAPVASTTALTVTLDGRGSMDGAGGNNVTCRWTFEDGQTATGCLVRRTYPGSGNHSATLWARSNVTDRESQAAGTSFSIVDRAPVASCNVQVTGDLTISYDGTGSTSGGGSPIRSYTWDFGDLTSATSASGGKVYTAPGSYTVRLTVANVSGGTSSCSVPVGVYRPPTPRVVVTTTGLPPQAAIFDASGSDKGGRTGVTWYYNWDFGRFGNTGWSTDPVYRAVDGARFPEPGTHSVTLRMCTANCPPDQDRTTQVTVTVYGPPTPAFTPVERAPQRIFFDGSASRYGGRPSSDYYWFYDFGDGTASGWQHNNSDAEHLYTRPGTYTVTMRMCMANCPAGYDVSTTRQVTVYASPTPGFSATPTADPLQVTLDGSASNTGGRGITDYYFRYDAVAGPWTGELMGWRQGNPGATVNLPAPGTYTVQMRMCIANCPSGYDASATRSVTVYGALIARATASSGAPLTATFDASASDRGGRDGVTWYYLWTFADGTNSGWLAAPTYTRTFGAPGTQTATLRLCTANCPPGQDASTTVSVAVYGSPTPSFQSTPSAPLHISLNGSASGTGGRPAGEYYFLYSATNGASTGWMLESPDGTLSFSGPGQYQVSLRMCTANCPAGYDVTATQTVTVYDRPLAVASGAAGGAEGTVQFSSAGSSPGGVPGGLTYAWTFSNGATSSEANPLVLVPGGGTVTGSLVVRNSWGWQSAASNASATVVVTQPYEARFTMRITPQCGEQCWIDADGAEYCDPVPGGRVDVDGSQSTDGGVPPLIYTWRWSNVYGVIGTTSGAVSSFSFAPDAVYDGNPAHVELTLANARAEQRVLAQSITFDCSARNPTAVIQVLSSRWDPALGAYRVRLTGAASTAPAGSAIVGYSWESPNGAVAGGGAPFRGHGVETEIVFAAGVSAQIRLNVQGQNSLGQLTYAYAHMVLGIGPAPPGSPQAQWSYRQLSNNGSTEVIGFDASVSTDGGSAPLAYSWDFGDFTTGIGVSPQHSYPVASGYWYQTYGTVWKVVLTVRNAAGVGSMRPGDVTGSYRQTANPCPTGQYHNGSYCACSTTHNPPVNGSCSTSGGGGTTTCQDPNSTTYGQEGACGACKTGYTSDSGQGRCVASSGSVQCSASPNPAILPEGGGSLSVTWTGSGENATPSFTSYNQSYGSPGSYTTTITGVTPAGETVTNSCQLAVQCPGGTNWDAGISSCSWNAPPPEPCPLDEPTPNGNVCPAGYQWSDTGIQGNNCGTCVLAPCPTGQVRSDQCPSGQSWTASAPGGLCGTCACPVGSVTQASCAAPKVWTALTAGSTCGECKDPVPLCEDGQPAPNGDVNQCPCPANMRRIDGVCQVYEVERGSAGKSALCRVSGGLSGEGTCTVSSYMCDAPYTKYSDGAVAFGEFRTVQTPQDGTGGPVEYYNVSPITLTPGGTARGGTWSCPF